MTKLDILIIIFFFCLLIAIGGWIRTSHAMKQATRHEASGEHEYAIILGAKVDDSTPSLSLRYRLEAALDYSSKHPNVKFILSGGQGLDEDISEAEAMYNFLSSHGVSETRMIIENQSTSTYENLQKSKQLLPDGTEGITLITSDYHIARAGFLAEQLGFQWDSVAAQTPKSVKIQVEFREHLALLKTWIMKK